MAFKMDVRETDGVAVVACSGRLVLGDEATALREQVKALLQRTRQIVLDLGNVSYIDSGGLGTLVGLYTSARAAGGDVKLSNLGSRLRDVLQVTKLVTVFEVYDHEKDAVAAFRRGAA